MQSDKHIDFTQMKGRKGDLGIVILQRPATLNALTVPMVQALHQQLITWASDPSIKAVIVRATPGRAFCAGGDIRSIYEKKLKNDPTLGDFFRYEYHLNKQIFHYPKPYIALLDGITLGGGAGISIHGSHRVATEHLSFAMPETGIGYFPDIGGSYFLPRLPHKMGYYLGLTGEHITYQDCLALGLVDTVVSSNSQDQLVKKLAESPLPDEHTITHIIQTFSAAVPESPLWAHRYEIEACFSEPTMEKIIHALETRNSAWCANIAKIIHTKSPTSLKITLHELQTGGLMNFDACMQMEERLSTYFMHSHDFFEGIRAALIDKDHMPKWNPAMLHHVSLDSVNNQFKRV